MGALSPWIEKENAFPTNCAFSEFLALFYGLGDFYASYHLQHKMNSELMKESNLITTFWSQSFTNFQLKLVLQIIAPKKISRWQNQCEQSGIPAADWTLLVFSNVQRREQLTSKQQKVIFLQTFLFLRSIYWHSLFMQLICDQNQRSFLVHELLSTDQVSIRD